MQKFAIVYDGYNLLSPNLGQHEHQPEGQQQHQHERAHTGRGREGWVVHHELGLRYG